MSSTSRTVRNSAARYVVLVFLAAFVLFPLYTMVTTALQDGTPSSSFTWLPQHFGFSAFIDMWSTAPLAQYFANSTIVAVAATAICVLFATLASFVLTRFNFRGKRVFLYLVLSTQAFPGVLFLLPLFVLFTGIQGALGVQLIGSYTGLIIVDLTFAMPFAIWMMTNYLATIPHDIEEAAMVDGASRLHAFLRVTLPVALPGVAAVFVFVFISAWSELLFATVFTNEQTRTLPVGLQTYLSPMGNVVYWNQLMASSLLVSVPIVIGFLAVQRFFVQGLGGGSLK